jgi:hypothetical protein
LRAHGGEERMKRRNVLVHRFCVRPLLVRRFTYSAFAVTVS